MNTKYISKIFSGAIFSGLIMLALFGISASNVMAARIKVQKQVCDSIGLQNTCKGNNDSLDGQTIRFDVFLNVAPFDSTTGVPTSGTAIGTIPVTLKQGGGNLGFETEGFPDNTELRVCERISDAPGFGSFPQPESSAGGSTGGNQTADGNCIILTTASNNGVTVVQFINLPVGTVTIIKDVANSTSATDFTSV